MPLTKDFKDTLKARMERSPDFRRAVLREAIECLLAGDVATGKIMIRDYINGTIEFEELGERTQTPPVGGHQDLMTTQRYMHLSPNMLDDAIRLLDAAGGGAKRCGDIVETLGSVSTSA